jgi:hypothetical protein
MIKDFISVFLLCCVWLSVHAADTVQFSSAYTDLSKDCKWLFKESELSKKAKIMP